MCCLCNYHFFDYQRDSIMILLFVVSSINVGIRLAIPFSVASRRPLQPPVKNCGASIRYNKPFGRRYEIDEDGCSHVLYAYRYCVYALPPQVINVELMLNNCRYRILQQDGRTKKGWREWTVDLLLITSIVDNCRLKVLN